MRLSFFVSTALVLSTLTAATGSYYDDDYYYHFQDCDISDYFASYTLAGSFSCPSSCDYDSFYYCDTSVPNTQVTTLVDGCEYCNKGDTICAALASYAIYAADYDTEVLDFIETVAYTKGNSRGILQIEYAFVDYEPYSVYTTFTKGSTTKKCSSSFRTNDSYGTLSIKLNCTNAGAGAKAQAEICLDQYGTFYKCPYKSSNAPLFGFLDNGAICGYPTSVSGATTSATAGNTSYQLAAKETFHGGRRMNRATKTIIHPDDSLKVKANISDATQQLLLTSATGAMAAAKAKQEEISNRHSHRHLREGTNMDE